MKKSRIVLIAVLALLVGVLAACGKSGNEGAGESAKIKVGLICGGMTPILAQIAMNDGSFENAGLEVEKVCFTAGADAIQALIGGSIDVNLGSYEHVLRQQKNGLGVKAYAEIFNGVGYSLVVKKDGPDSLAALKGASLAVTKVGSLSDTGLRIGLKDAGLDPEKDVSIINGGSGATMLAAIDGGTVAGGMVSEPTTSQMLDTGNYKLLYDPKIDFSGIVVMAKTDWADKNKETMKKFLATMKEVNERTQKDPAPAVTALQQDFDQIPANVLEQAIQNQLAKIKPDLKLTQEAAKNVTDSQLELGAIAEEIPFDQTVDMSLLP